jgi:hypothetical protein
MIVPGRQCGACTVCCKLLPVNTDGLRKTSNVLCSHCDEGRGCQIYERRPRVCRDFYCEWRLNPQIPATWRPDKSAIFIQRISREHIEEMPRGYDSDYAILLMLLRPDAIERPAVVETITDYIFRRIPTFIGIPGPPGHLPTQIFLNDAVQSAAATRDFTAMTIILRQALAALHQDKFDPVPDFG